MDDATKAARAASFSSVADAYERARPGYPGDAVAWLAGEAPCDVLDLAAGTGKLTRQLAAAGHRVVAVEPLGEMLDRLRAVVPGCDARVGSAEAIPLPDASVDLVAAAQAFHWFDAQPALAEIARVLRPGGSVALIWNMRETGDAWLRRLSDLMGSEAMGKGYPAEEIDRSGLFGPVEQRTFAHAHTVDRAGLRDLVLSRSHCATREPAEREEILRDVEELYDEAAGPDGVVVVYETEAFKARRLP